MAPEDIPEGHIRCSRCAAALSRETASALCALKEQWRQLKIVGKLVLVFLEICADLVAAYGFGPDHEAACITRPALTIDPTDYKIARRMGGLFFQNEGTFVP